MQQAGADPARPRRRSRAAGARADIAPQPPQLRGQPAGKNAVYEPAGKKRSAIGELVEALDAGAGRIGGKRLTAEQHALLVYAAHTLRVVLDRTPAEVRKLKDCLYPRHAISEAEVERFLVTLLGLARP
jgi:hypothetical protein